MSGINKEALLASLIAAGHEPSIEYAFALVQGINANGTNAVKSTAPGAVVEGEETEDDVVVEHGGVETDASTLDKRGFPWDSRIHAKTKTQNKDGTWKYAVGVDKAVLVPQVEAELREGGYGQPQTDTAPPVTTAPPVAAATPGAPPVNAAAPGLPGAPPAAPGLPPVTVTAPAKVEFPVVANEDDMDDNALIQTAAALYAKHGEEVVTKLLTMFAVPAGGTAKDVPAGFKFSFWQYAVSDEYLKQQAII